MAAARAAASAPGTSAELRGALFDVDGTLALSDGLHFEVFKEMCREKGARGVGDALVGKLMDEQYFLEHISGRANADIFRELFPDMTDQAEIDAFAEEKEQRFRDRVEAGGLEMMPGLTAFLDMLDDSGVQICAVTNAPRLNAELMLSGLGIAGRFEHLVIGNECTRPKPFPDPYLEGMRLLGVTPEESVAFEDSPSGLTAAVAAGIPTVGILSSQSAATLTSAGAVLCVPDFAGAELAAYMAKRAGPAVVSAA